MAQKRLHQTPSDVAEAARQRALPDVPTIDETRAGRQQRFAERHHTPGKISRVRWRYRPEFRRIG